MEQWCQTQMRYLYFANAFQYVNILLKLPRHITLLSKSICTRHTCVGAFCSAHGFLSHRSKISTSPNRWFYGLQSTPLILLVNRFDSCSSVNRCRRCDVPSILYTSGRIIAWNRLECNTFPLQKKKNSLFHITSQYFRAWFALWCVFMFFCYPFIFPFL